MSKSKSKDAYDGYLKLPELLGLQRPRGQGQPEPIRSSELFFIVVHQSAELLLRQVVDDLRAFDRAVGDRSSCDWTAVAARLRRAAAVVDLLRGHVEVLEYLPREHFLVFREELGTASASGSRQFADVFALLGGVPATPLPPGVSAELAALRGELRRWQVSHIALVKRMIGEATGTGGTAGVAWLRSRLVAQ